MSSAGFVERAATFSGLSVQVDLGRLFYSTQKSVGLSRCSAFAQVTRVQRSRLAMVERWDIPCHRAGLSVFRTCPLIFRGARVSGSKCSGAHNVMNQATHGKLQLFQRHARRKVCQCAVVVKRGMRTNLGISGCWDWVSEHFPQSFLESSRQIRDGLALDDVFETKAVPTPRCSRGLGPLGKLMSRLRAIAYLYGHRHISCLTLLA